MPNCPCYNSDHACSEPPEQKLVLIYTNPTCPCAVLRLAPFVTKLKLTRREDSNTHFSTGNNGVTSFCPTTGFTGSVVAAAGNARSPSNAPARAVKLTLSCQFQPEEV